MKKIIFILILFLLLLVNLSAQTYPEWSLYFELDVYLGLKIGTEYRFTEHFGLCGSAGLCVIAWTQIVYNLFFVYHILDFGYPFQMDIEAGFLQCAFDVIAPILAPEELPNPYSYWNPGLALFLGYQHNKTFQIGLRGGAHILVGHDKGEWRRDYMILPNIAIEYLLFLM